MEEAKLCWSTKLGQNNNKQTKKQSTPTLKNYRQLEYAKNTKQKKDLGIIQIKPCQIT